MMEGKTDRQKSVYFSLNFLQTTIDEEEVERLSRPTSDWWRLNGDFAALHSMNKLRVSFIKNSLDHLHSQNSTLSKPLGGFRILDVGCGGGILSEVSSFKPIKLFLDEA